MTFTAERPGGLQETFPPVEMRGELSSGSFDARPLLSEEASYFSIERMDAVRSSVFVGVSAIGILVLLGPEIGAIAALTGAMMVGGSIAFTIVNLAGSEAQLHEVEEVKALLCGPFGLVGGAIGAALQGETGMKTGSQIGGLVDFWKTFNLKENSALLDRLAEASGVFDAGNDLRKQVEHLLKALDSDSEGSAPTTNRLFFDIPPPLDNYDMDREIMPYEDLPGEYIA